MGQVDITGDLKQNGSSEQLCDLEPVYHGSWLLVHMGFDLC
jgi:hydrogenase maturation factor